MLRKNLSEMTLLSPDGAQGGGAGAQAAGGQGSGASSTAQQIFGGEDGSTDGQQRNDDGAGAQSAQDQSQQGQQGGAAAASGQGGTPPNVIPLDAVEKIVKTMAAQQAKAASQQTQQPQMSQEEFDKLFNVYRPTPELIAALRAEDPTEGVTALTQMVQGVVRQAATMAAFHTMQEMQKLQQQLSPAMEFVQSQQMDRLKNEFFEAYPNLKGLEPLLLQIRDSLIKEGKNFESKEDAFKAVAERAQEILTKIPGYTGGSTNNNNGGQQTQQAAGQQGRRMPTLSGKGQGGGAGGKGSAATMNTARRIFGPHQ